LGESIVLDNTEFLHGHYINGITSVTIRVSSSIWTCGVLVGR